MPKRPTLTDSTFLAAVFSPKKNPAPTGLRKRKLTSVAGRKASRLKSYNAMSALNQRILSESKQREAYLRGDITINEAKRALRPRAVELGIVKPLKGKTAAKPIGGIDGRASVFSHLRNELKKTGTKKPVNIAALRRGTLVMRPDQLRRALAMDGDAIKEAGRDDNEEITVDENTTLNPFWYH